jgi:hypothetical protein
MRDSRFKIAVPARLSVDETEARELLDLVVELAEKTGFEVTVVDDGDHLDEFDGFVVPGGGDVDPELYGETVQPGEVYDVNPAQDALDLQVLEFAAANDKPLLAICRGAQLLNVQRGGTLHVDLEPSQVVHLPSEPRRDDIRDDIRDIFVWHDVALLRTLRWPLLREALGFAWRQVIIRAFARWERVSRSSPRPRTDWSRRLQAIDPASGSSACNGIPRSRTETRQASRLHSCCCGKH